jgi:hypothetical protein
MTVLGFDIETEVAVSKGRIDAVLDFGGNIYVMEFKYVKCAPGAGAEEKAKLTEKALDDGMAQLRSKGYHEKYIGSGKPIYQAAFAFLGRDEIEMRCVKF